MGVERLGKHEEQTTDKPALPEAEPLDFSGYKLRNGHSKKHRGNHRSENKGRGIFAFFRNRWQKNVG